MNDDLIALAQEADMLVHQLAGGGRAERAGLCFRGHHRGPRTACAERCHARRAKAD